MSFSVCKGQGQAVRRDGWQRLPLETLNRDAPGHRTRPWATGLWSFQEGTRPEITPPPLSLSSLQSPSKLLPKG